jgi:hypothetical protein
MNYKIMFKHRKLYSNNKAMIYVQKKICIEVDLVFVMARTGTWGILGVFRHDGHVAAFFWVSE